ncbi:MAG: LAGLIDADG family homing endonuclease [Promethearchaeia archaeon]
MTTPSSKPTKPMNPTQEFEDFFRYYLEKPGVYKYHEQIKRIDSKGENTLVILYEDLLNHKYKLAKMLEEDPENMLEHAVKAFKNLLKFESGGKLNHERYFVRVATKDDKSPLTVPIRQMRAENIDNLVWFKGILIRSSKIRPKLTKASFECLLCGTQFEVVQLTSKIKWPKFCINKQCKAKAQNDFKLITRDSEFIDWQSITIQEIPEDLPAGRIPRSVQAILTHDLVDYVKPGDRVSIMGIYKSVIAGSIRSNNSNLFKTYIKVNYVDPEDKSDLDIDISKDDKKAIQQLSQEPMVQRKISRSIAPQIFGREQLKMACALSLFGGTKKKKPGGGWKRGDIHVLFVGDPGTGKSEIIKSAVEVSPRGLYTSGKGASAVGLTAAVIKDADTGQMNLEAGAIVLANGGVAAIDEFDKMDKADRSALHEAMEQQSYHYDTEILDVNGKKIKIGKYVDDLLENNADDVVKGVNCEILPHEDIGLYTTDFQKIYKTKIHRVSRHKSPDRFYQIKFSNGRTIKVTPEHPIFVFRNGKLATVDAKDCKVNDFIPIPEYLPNSSQPIMLGSTRFKPRPTAEEIVFPEVLTPNLARILGYLIAEGHSYVGSSTEIGFTTRDEKLLDEFYNLMEQVFQILPNINRRDDGRCTLRYTSVELYKWFKLNFPEIMVKSIHKRIPKKIMGASKEIAEEFIKTSFKGDGSVESTSICYKTACKGFSEDYQDLLLKLGIQSRIIVDSNNDSFNVYIRGQSLIDFFHIIVEKDDRRYKQIKNIIKLNKTETNHHDIFPTSIIEEILQIKKALSMKITRPYWRYSKKGEGITRNNLIKQIRKIESRIGKIKDYIGKEKTIKAIKKSGFSQQKISEIASVTRSNIDYYGKGGYDKFKGNELNRKVVFSVLDHFEDLEKRIQRIKNLVSSEILWDRIKSIKVIKNKGENYRPYVYDLTVEPTHTFISNGLVLHNTVSIAKAGIVATLKAETAVVAAANPHFGRYDSYKTPTQNIRMPPSLLSRFDLIFVVKDKPDKSYDAQLAEFILKNAMGKFGEDEDGKGKSESPIQHELLKKYIKHARRNCKPILTHDAKERIKEYYLDLRGKSDSEEAIISILARNLDALIRMSEAYAKMALREKVLEDDVKEVIKLFDRFLTDTGYDEATGKIDVDRIVAGESRSKLNKLENLLDRMKEMFSENNWQELQRKDIIQSLELEEDLDKKFVQDALENLIRDGDIYEPKPGYIKFTRKQT